MGSKRTIVRQKADKTSFLTNNDIFKYKGRKQKYIVTKTANNGSITYKSRTTGKIFKTNKRKDVSRYFIGVRQ